MSSSILPKKIGSLPEVAKPLFMEVNNEQLVISDQAPKVLLYSISPFKFLKEISRRGDGPSECNAVPQLVIGKNYIYLYELGRCIYFNRDGSYKSQFRVPQPHNILLAPLGDNFLWIKRPPEDGMEMSIYSQIKNKEFQYKKLIYLYLFDKNKSFGGKMEYPIVKDYCGAILHDDRVFIGDSKRGLYVEGFDSKGNQFCKIKLDIEKSKIQEEYKEDWMKRAKQEKLWSYFSNIYTIVFPEYYPSFYRFDEDNGKIYFLTYNKKNTNREVLITDLKGKLLKRIWVPWVENEMYTNFSIENGKFYYIIDNEESEVWELHAVDIL